MFGFFKKIFGTQQERAVRRFSKIVKRVNQEEELLKNLSNEDIKHKTVEFRERIKKGESLDDLLPEAYAVVKNMCRRMSGRPVHVSGYDQLWDMVPYDVQLIGGIAMHNGAIAEMQTGEGKTLTAVMPLYLNALTGKPVHLVTVNDYLAKRDCEWVGTILRELGLTTGVLTNDVPTHARKEIYKADVVYGTASEFGFDYLRDNSMASNKEEQVQRGYYFAIIDEVDSILIDEARTPLIISGPVPESRQMYDELKGSVANLVRYQRDLCNRYATEAKKTLDPVVELGGEAEKKLDKKEEREALKKLWLVHKGTPHNKMLKRLKEDPDIRANLDRLDLYYHSDQNKEEKEKLLSELYLLIDERGSEFEITDRGMRQWPECTGNKGSIEDFVMLDLGDAYHKVDQDTSLSTEQKLEAKLAIQVEDARRKERAHNVRQLLRGHLLMEKDVDYIVQDGKVVIIDENTGRPQPGRRFSDGLHQAIEAKEGLEIQKETQTYATITLQNFFRMYDKLSGMTGTAMTEAQELREIYQLDVLQIPANRPCIRIDENDEIYMTEREKYQAIVKDIKNVHEKGRPILIGTESVEISEKLSRILKGNKIEHTVLNARHHEREAEIVAHAGKRAAVTIATNMAGRGTDIKLEKGVAEVGGLYVLGTSRHPSRRIDRQLRGRSARQGDPGSSRFYLSFEDELLRLFSGSNMTKVIQRFRPPEGEPISAKILNRSIETAQKRIEQRNYLMRKHTLEYDDVMNIQRKEIYAFRNDVLRQEDIMLIAHSLLEQVVQAGAEKFFISRSQEGGWDSKGFRSWLMQHFPITFEDDAFEDDLLTIEEIETQAAQIVKEALDHKIHFENEKIRIFSSNNPLFTIGKTAQEVVRDLTIRTLDRLWIEHLLSMDHLRQDVMLRTHGQKDPLLEFKQEAFRLFSEFSQNLKEEVGKILFRFQIVPSQGPSRPAPPPRSTLNFEKNRNLAEEIDRAGPNTPVERGPAPSAKVQPLVLPPEESPRNRPIS